MINSAAAWKIFSFLLKEQFHKEGKGWTSDLCYLHYFHWIKSHAQHSLQTFVCTKAHSWMSTTQTKTHTHTQTHAPKQAGTRLCPSRAFRSTNTILSHFGVSHGLGDRQGCIINNWLGMCVRVCVYQSSSVCVRVRKSVRVQVKAEPSAADKPHQVSLLCLTRTQPLASGGEKPLIGKGRNTHIDTHTHTCFNTTHTHADWRSATVVHRIVRTKRQKYKETDGHTHTHKSGSERQHYSLCLLCTARPGRRAHITVANNTRCLPADFLLNFLT